MGLKRVFSGAGALLLVSMVVQAGGLPAAGQGAAPIAPTTKGEAVPATATAPPSTKEATPPTEEAKTVATRPPSSFPTEPSVYETGRVGTMHVSDKGSRIAQTPPPPPREEQSIERAAAEVATDRTAAPLPGSIDAAILSQQLDQRLAGLHECRVELARSKKLPLTKVGASKLTLRWTIVRTGAVANTEVVAINRTSPHLIDCVKRQMSQWTFAPPQGGVVRLSRTIRP